MACCHCCHCCHCTSDQGPLLEKFGGGLAAFLGMEEHPLLLTLHDPTMELRCMTRVQVQVQVQVQHP